MHCDGERVAEEFRRLVAAGRDGFCLDGTGREVRRDGGYVVGVGPAVDSIEAAVAVAGPGQLFGYWEDGGVGHVDLVRIYDGKATAVLAARELGERAIYGFAEGLVPIGGDDDAGGDPGDAAAAA